MDYYFTSKSEQHLRAALVSMYESKRGVQLSFDLKTGQKIVPDNDGSLQWHLFFDRWTIDAGIRGPDPDNITWEKEPVLKPGHHCLVKILVTERNPRGEISEADISTLRAAGIEVLRADEIDPEQLALLPKFQ